MTDPDLRRTLALLHAELSAQLNRELALQAAFVTLALHLEERGAIDAPVLTASLQTMSRTQPGEGWQECLQSLATALQSARPNPGARR